MNAARVNRFDVSEIGKPTRTPQGFLKIPGFPTRVGVFPYRRADGTTVLELRHPDEVFKADSLATLAAAPVTNLHPSEPVTPKNVRQLQVGIVGESVRKDGDKVSAHVTVQDADMIAMVERGERREISCGYQCRLDETPGVWNGQRYDAVQRDIVYNHAALGPRNWGRQGSEVALRLDSGDAVIADTFQAPPEPRADNADPAGGHLMDLITLRIDSVEIQVPKAWASFVTEALKKRDDSIVALTTARDTLQGKVDSDAKEITRLTGELKTKTDELADTKRLDSLVTARASLLASAGRVLPTDFKFDGMTTRQVQVAVLKKLDDKFDDKDRSDDYVTGLYEAEIKRIAAGRNDGGNNGPRNPFGGPAGNGGRNDGGSGAAPAAAPAPYIPAWQRDTSTTRK